MNKTMNLIVYRGGLSWFGLCNLCVFCLNEVFCSGPSLDG